MWFESAGRPIKYIDGNLAMTTRGEQIFTSGGHSWAKYENWYAVHDECGGSFFNCHNDEEIYSFHNGGSYFGMGDGSVRFLTDSLDPDLFVSLFTRDGGDVVDGSKF